jgi:hypothetical protein
MSQPPGSAPRTPTTATHLARLPSGVITKIFEFLERPRTKDDWDASGLFEKVWQQSKDECGIRTVRGPYKDTPEYHQTLSRFRGHRDDWLRKDTIPLAVLALGRSVFPASDMHAVRFRPDPFIDAHAHAVMWDRAKSECGHHLLTRTMTRDTTSPHDDHSQILTRYYGFRAAWDQPPSLETFSLSPLIKKRSSETTLTLDESPSKRRTENRDDAVDVTPPVANRCLLPAFFAAAAP